MSEEPVPANTTIQVDTTTQLQEIVTSKAADDTDGICGSAANTMQNSSSQLIERYEDQQK